MTERKVIYSQMVSLDGYIEGPNQDIEWGKPGEELFQHFNDQDNNIDTHIYGRRTYENMRDYWSKRADNPEASKEEVEFSEVWNNIEKVVFSTTIKNVEGNCILIRDSVQTEIEKLKKQSGKDMSLGGATLAKTFISLGLIDEYHLYIHPILLGDGRRLFPGLQANTNLVLLESKVFDQAVMMLRYAPIRKKQVKEER